MPRRLDELDPSTFTDPDEFSEAVESFRARVPMTRPEWDALVEEARQYGFTISGTMQADVIQQIFDALHASIKDGTPFDDFKQAVSSTLIDAWRGTVANPPARLQVIFRTNIVSAQSAGRYHQMSHPVVRELRPYIRSTPVEDNRESEICKDIGEVILRADDPWWQTHWSPLHFQCRRIQDTLSEEEAKAEGISRHGPNVPAQEGFGRAPAAAVPTYEPDHDEYDPDVSSILRQHLDDAGDYESTDRLRAGPITAEQAVDRLLMLLAA